MRDVPDKQYHEQHTARGREIWDVERLIDLARELEPKNVPIGAIFEFDEVYWFDADRFPATCRAVVEHARRIHAVDLAHPIILSSRGLVMDGMHRVAKAVLLGHTQIRALQFAEDPAPDRIEPAEES